jgi:hypothetical protein
MIGVLAWWLYNANDRSRRSKMAEVHDRKELRDSAALSDLENNMGYDNHMNHKSD